MYVWLGTYRNATDGLSEAEPIDTECCEILLTNPVEQSSISALSAELTQQACRLPARQASAPKHPRNISFLLVSPHRLLLILGKSSVCGLPGPWKGL